VLDVGIGTASALCENANAVRDRGLEVVGVDYEERYVNFARKKILNDGLASNVRVIRASVYDDDLGERVGGKKFDAVYFSGSISLMPDPAEALRVAARLLRPGGRIYVTQTFQNRSFPLLSTVKPLLKYLTTIDFGQLIFQREILDVAKRAGLGVEENAPIPGSVDNRWQTARLLVLAP